MFKLVVLSALLAVAIARPGHLGSPVVYSSPIIQEHSLAHVGAIVKSVPTAVSHQSSTVVHDSAHIVEPIVAPVVKTYAAAPLVQSYAAPLAIAAPAHYGYAASAPAHLAYSAPLSYGHGW